MLFEDHFTARGHVNVRGTHATTAMLTTDPHLTVKGDCIVAVSATKGLAGLPGSLKEAARSPDARITLILKVGDSVESITGRGHPDLSFADPRDMVARKSGYVCPRTLMVHADRAAIDLPAAFRRLLRDPEAFVEVTVRVETP